MFFVWGPIWFVVGFLVVGWLIALVNHSGEARAPRCPYCKGIVNQGAVKCVHCGSNLWITPQKATPVRGTLVGGWGEMEDQNGQGKQSSLR